MLIDTQSTDKKVMKLNVAVRKINEDGLSSLLYCFTYVGEFSMVHGVARDRVNELLEENFTLNDLKILEAPMKKLDGNVHMVLGGYADSNETERYYWQRHTCKGSFIHE